MNTKNQEAIVSLPAELEHKSKINTIFYFSLMVILASLFLGLTACSDDSKSPSKEEGFQKDLGNVVDATTDFISKAVTYESARFDTLELKEIEKIFFEYLDAGDVFVANAQKVIAQSQQNKSAPKNGIAKDCIMAAAGFFDISGISASLIMDISDLIEMTRDTVRALNQAWEMGIIDDNQYNDLLNNVRINKPLDAVGVGFSTVMGTGAGTFTALACGAAGVATAPALITVGVVGGVVSYGTYKIWSWYRGSKKSNEQLFISSVTGKLGEPIPATLFAEGASMAISIDGYEPILIESLPYPDHGNVMNIEVEAVKLGALQNQNMQAGNWKSSEGMVEVCFFQETAAGNDCSMIAYVSGNALPPNPSPGQSVTVVGSVMPVTPNCEISFSIVGTDGYTNSGTYQTNSQGQASFGIPGAAHGVIDKVTITTANGSSYMVTYVFSGASKSGPVPCRVAASN